MLEYFFLFFFTRCWRRAFYWRPPGQINALPEKQVGKRQVIDSLDIPPRLDVQCADVRVIGAPVITKCLLLNLDLLRV